jgi:fused signal recognition particle receptor
MGLFDFFKKKEVLNIEEKETLDKGLEKTKEGIFSKLSRAVVGKCELQEINSSIPAS